MQTIRAFLSSTWLDLEPERKAVEQLIQRFDRVRFAGMEYFGSRSDDTRTTSLVEVDRSELYIGIFGHRYGSGITEAEYRRARERNLPCLLYFKGDGASSSASDDAPALEALKTELRHAHTVSDFSTPSDLAAKLAADLHHWLFDRYITQGIAALSVPFAERIQSFLAEYTGTVDQPIPFGGRAEDIRQLTEWLTDADGSPLLVLAAPAGRGKSALLVRWGREVSARDDVAVVFFPISIRFNTNLAQAIFPALAARLASLHGEPLEVPPDATTDLWRSLLANYLGRPLPDGRRLLLIVDGIDEAADWEAGPDLFPRTLAPGTRIVVSARFLPHLDALGWVRRLGWDGPGESQAMTLQPLSAAGVADVLEHFRIELRDLGSRVDVVAELHRLSEGDPLLIRLYVTALAADRGASRLEPKDLSQIQPGLEGFFTRWWDDQRHLWGASTPLREPAVQALLNLLACALGPLQRADLLQLSPAEAHLNAWTLDDALKPISRFVIGNGIEQGYAFSHPRLGSYFYDRLEKAREARQHEQRYVAWGQDVLGSLRERRITAKDVPVYVIQYLRAHLERTGAGIEALADLVSLEWLTAWSALDKGSFTGFLADVRRIWLAAEKADAVAVRAGERAQFLDLEVRCALCLSSVISMAADIPSTFLNTLVQRGVWTPTQGLAYASNKPIPELRVDALLQLATVVPEAQRDPLLGAALSAARTVVDLHERDRLLVRVSEWLEEPLAALRHVQDRTLRLDEIALCAGAGPRRQVDVVVQAIEEARGEQDLFRRLRWVQALGQHLPAPHRQRATQVVAHTIEALLDAGADVWAVLAQTSSAPTTLIERCMDDIDRAPVLERMDKIGALAGRTSGDTQDRVIAAGLHAIRMSSSDEQRLELLRTLVNAFPDDRRDALDPIVDLFEQDLLRLRARILILARAWESAPPRARVEALLGDLASWPDDDTRAILLQDLMGFLSREEATLLLLLAARQPVHVRNALRRAHFDERPEWARAAEDVATSAIARQRNPADRARLACDLASHARVEFPNDPLGNRLFRLALAAVDDVAAADEQGALLIELAVFAPYEMERALLDRAEALNARWTIAIVLEALTFGVGGTLARERLQSAFERLDGPDARARAAAWVMRCTGIDLRPTPALPVAEPLPLPRHELGRPNAATAPSPQRTAEITQSLEGREYISLEEAVDWVEGVKAELALFPDEPFQTVLDVVGSWVHADAAIAVCRAIAEMCVEPVRQQLVLEVAVAILLPFVKKGAPEHVETLLAIAPQLDSDRQTSALIEALKSVTEQTSPAMRSHVIDAVLRLPNPSSTLVVFAIEDGLAKQMGLGAFRQLTGLLPRAIVPRVIAAAMLVEGSFGDSALTEVLAAVPDPSWQAVLDVVTTVADELLRARALVRLAGFGDDALKRQIVAALRKLTDPLTRARALGHIVPLLEDELAEQALADGWTAMRGAAEDGTVIALLTDRTIGSKIRHAVLPDAVTTVLTVLDLQQRARAIEALAPHLSADLLEHALKGLQMLRDDSERAHTLTALLAALHATIDRAQVAELATRTGRGIPWADRRAMRLAALALLVEGDQREGLLRDALEAIRLTPEKSRTEPLLMIGAALAGASEALMAETLTLADRLPWSANEAGTAGAPKPAVLQAILPNLATSLLVKAFAIGGDRVASPLERIRLLTYLARDVDSWSTLQASGGGHDQLERRLAVVKSIDRGIGSNTQVVQRLDMLLKGGPLALDREPVRGAHHRRLWREDDPGAPLTRAFERALAEGPAHGPPEFARLTSHLDSDGIRSAIGMLHAVGDETLRAAMLRASAPFLPSELLPDALSIVRTLSDAGERAATLVRLMPLLPLPWPSGVLPNIRSLPDAEERGWLLRTMALRATGPRQESIVREALDAARAITTETGRARLIIDLADRLPADLLRLIVQSIPLIDDPASEAGALIAMVPQMTASDEAVLAAAVTRLAGEEQQASVLYALARFGRDDLLAASWRMTASIANPFRRALLIGVLAPRLSPDLQEAALEAAAAISNASARAEALSAIAQHAPGPIPHDVVIRLGRDVRCIADEGYRLDLAKPMLRHLAAGDASLAFGLVGELRDEDIRADALRAVIDVAPEDWWDGLKDLVDPIHDPHHRAVLRAELASLASPLERTAGIAEALAIAARVSGRQARADALVEMAIRVRQPDTELVAHALEAVIALRRPAYSADVIEQLSPRFDERLASQTVAYARSVPDETLRVRIMAAAAQRLDSSGISGLLQEVRALRRSVQRRELLCELAPFITEDVWPEAIAAATASLPEAYQADVLTVFAGHMPDTARRLAAEAAGRLVQPEPAAKALWGLGVLQVVQPADQTAHAGSAQTPETPASLSTAELIELFGPLLSTPVPPLSPKPRLRLTPTRLRAMGSELDRIATLGSLASALDDDQAIGILGLVDEMSTASRRAAALKTLAPYATPPVTPLLWQSLRRITDTELYASVLLPLAPGLCALPAPQAHDLFADILRVLASGKRSILLDGVRALVPVLAKLGQQRELTDTAVSINEVGTWWP